jgi:hypothetical protein
MSSIAMRWSGVSTYGNASSISCCHGVSCAKAWPVGVDALLVEHHQFLGDLADRRPHLALGLREVGTTEACSFGASPPTY